MQSRDVCTGTPAELDSFIYSIVSYIIIEQNPVLGIAGEEIIKLCPTMDVTSNAPYNFRNHECLTFLFKQILKTFGEHNWHQQWSLQQLTGCSHPPQRRPVSQLPVDTRASLPGRGSTAFVLLSQKHTM